MRESTVTGNYPDQTNEKVFTLIKVLLATDHAIILQSVRFNNQCSITHRKSWRWLLTWWRSLHLFLPQKHDSAVSRAGVLIMPSTALQEHLGWDKHSTASMRKRCFLKQIRRFVLSQLPDPRIHRHAVWFWTNPSCFVILLFLYCICHFMFILSMAMQLYRSIQLSTNLRTLKDAPVMDFVQVYNFF